MATFSELRGQAEQEIRGQVRSQDSDDTDYFVEQAADLLAALRLWADTQQRTAEDVRSVIDSGTATMLKNIATELGEGGGDDALEASRRLEAIAYGPSDRLSETFEFVRKGPSAELRERGRLVGLMPGHRPADRANAAQTNVEGVTAGESINGDLRTKAW